MNKYILSAVVVLVAITGLFWFRTNETSLSPSQEAQTKTPADNIAIMPTVEYTNEGFFPAEITIKTGTTVTFVNQSDTPMWVASAPHPAHTLYSEFDAKASVSKGGSYSFTFNKMGGYPYHNHLLLGKYGKIIVE